MWVLRLTAFWFVLMLTFCGMLLLLIPCFLTWKWSAYNILLNSMDILIDHIAESPWK